MEMPRFIEKVKVAASGCWEWQAGKRNGYGQFWDAGKQHRASRWIFQAFNGQITTPYYVLHRCGNRSCVNPLHLYRGTSSDNMKDRHNPNRKRPKSPQQHLKNLKPEDLLG